MAECKKEYWALFERLFRTDLVNDWQQMAQTETYTKGHIAKEEVNVTTSKHIKNFGSVEWCVRT